MLPKGIGGLGNLGNIMKQAMDLKENMEHMKDELAKEQVEGSAGGGMVTVIANGKMEILSIKIDPDIIDRDDPEMLETLVAAAVNEGVRKAQELMQKKMSEMTGGLDIPGLT